MTKGMSLKSAADASTKQIAFVEHYVYGGMSQWEAYKIAYGKDELNPDDPDDRHRMINRAKSVASSEVVRRMIIEAKEHLSAVVPFSALHGYENAKAAYEIAFSQKNVPGMISATKLMLETGGWSPKRNADSIVNVNGNDVVVTFLGMGENGTDVTVGNTSRAPAMIDSGDADRDE